MTRLSMAAIRERQRGLAALTLYNGPLDGVAGPKTQTAIADFCAFEQLDPDSDDIAERLYEKVMALPVEQYREPEDLARTLHAVCKSLYRDDLKLPAYMMGTVQHETKAAYYPVEEAYYVTSEAARLRYLKGQNYWPYYGRGLVQLTWDFNYKKYGEILNLNLLGEPELVLEPSISLFILVHGMLTGTYTGKPLEQFINANACNYIQARRVVNGVRKGETLPDKAELIASYAKQWESFYAAR